MCGIIDSGSWNTCHNQTGTKNCGFAICSSLMMREIVCSFIIIFKHFDINVWDKDPRQGCNVSQIHTNKENQISNISKKEPGALLNLAILAFSPILTFEPYHQQIFQKISKIQAHLLLRVYWFEPPAPLEFQFTFILSFRTFGLLEKILRLPVMRISMLYYCKGLTIKIIQGGY